MFVDKERDGVVRICFAARWTLDPDVDPHYSAAVKVKRR